MDGSAGSTGALVGVLLAVGFVIRIVMLHGRRRPTYPQPPRPPTYAPPARRPSPPRSPGLVATAQQDINHPDAGVRHNATAYLNGVVGDEQFVQTRTYLSHLLSVPPEPQDAIPPEYRADRERA